jgi:hypothetical protein
MVPAVAQIADQGKVLAAARAQTDGGPVGSHPWAVGGDEGVCAECLHVGLDDLAHTGRPVLLAGLDHEFGVEAQLSPGFQHGAHGGHVDGVLALVVGGAPAIQPVAVARGLPGPGALGPLVVEAPDHWP